MPLLCRMPWAPCNGTTSTPPKFVVMLAPNHSTLQWHPAMAPRPIPQSWPSPSPPTIAHYNGTTSISPKVGRHPPPNHRTLQWHNAMAPSNGTTSTPPKFPPNHSTLQWHPAMPPRPLPQSWSSPSPQPYHTTMAPYNGTQQWHQPRPLPQNWSSTPPSTHTTMAMCSGTQQWHHVHCTLQCNGTLVPRPISQSGSSPSPPIGSKNPYSYRYLGKNSFGNVQQASNIDDESLIKSV